MRVNRSGLLHFNEAFTITAFDERCAFVVARRFHMALLPQWHFPLLCAALLMAGAVTPAQAQSPACAEYRAELTLLERSVAGPPPAGEIERLNHAWQQMGCGRGLSVFNSAARECDALGQRITQMQEGPRLSRANAMRHAELTRLVSMYCQAAPRPREARGSSVQIDQGNALSAHSIDPPLSVTPDPSVIVEDLKPPAPPPPVNATCVRLCDGFPFPLSVSPGGREGADQMCQALCPGAPSKAFFKNGSMLSAATDSDGKKYSSLAAAGLYQKQHDPACSCKPQGQTWNSALRRAGELAGKESTDTVVQDEPIKRSSLSTLRGSAQPEPARRKNTGPAAIDLDDEPLPLEKPQTGIVHLTPIEPPAPQITPKPETPPVQPDGKRTVRIVGPSLESPDVPGLKKPNPQRN